MHLGFRSDSVYQPDIAGVPPFGDKAHLQRNEIKRAPTFVHSSNEGRFTPCSQAPRLIVVILQRNSPFSAHRRQLTQTKSQTAV